MRPIGSHVNIFIHFYTNFLLLCNARETVENSEDLVHKVHKSLTQKLHRRDAEVAEKTIRGDKFLKEIQEDAERQGWAQLEGL